MSLHRQIKARDAQLIHGEGGRMNLILPPSHKETSSDFATRLQHNASNLIRKGQVSDTSHSTYSQGYKAWISFCKLLGVHRSISVVPAGSSHVSLLQFQLSTIGSFLTYIAVDRNRSANTALVYLSGVQDQFRREGYHELPTAHRDIVGLKAAIKIRHRNFSGDRGATGTLPFTLQMLHSLSTEYTNWNDYKDVCKVLCIKLAISLAAGCSEVIATTADHFIRGCDVVFFINVQGSVKQRQVLPKFVSVYTLHQVALITFNLRSAKNDINGDGEKRPVDVQAVGATCMFCIVQDCYHWACMAKPESNESDPSSIAQKIFE